MPLKSITLLVSQSPINSKESKLNLGTFLNIRLIFKTLLTSHFASSDMPVLEITPGKFSNIDSMSRALLVSNSG